MHRTAHGPWWFSSNGSGRFDLRGPRGTCYLAADPVGALLEAHQGLTVVTDEVLAERHLLDAQVPRPLRLANCCAPRAREFGVNAEIHDSPDYEKTNRWAAAFETSGFAGVRYFVRSDPSRNLVGYALFGTAGDRAGDWPAGTSRPVPDAVLRSAERWGFRVRPTPE
ncbi:MAG: RES family NAD+ phosphorylase [Thermoleophilaceae bacterium]